MLKTDTETLMTLSESLSRLTESLGRIRLEYERARAIVRDLHARDMPDQEMAYWLGIVHSFSKQAFDDLRAVDEGIDKLRRYMKAQYSHAQDGC